MKYKNIKYSVDEVLLCNMRKRGRKGGRMEPDFSGPYIIQSICGKLVSLSTLEGDVLKNKYNIDHIKPYRRSPTDVPDQKGQAPSEVDKTTSAVSPKICPLPNAQSRPSVIQSCKKMATEPMDTDKGVKRKVDDRQEMDQIPAKIKRSIQQEGLIAAMNLVLVF